MDGDAAPRRLRPARAGARRRLPAAVAAIAVVLAAGVVAALVAGRGGPGAPTYPVPPLPWRAGMETGDLSEWYAGQDSRPEAEQHSGSGTCTVSSTVAHTGTKSLLCTAFAPGDATRMFRFAEPRSGIPLVYTAWFYLPRHVTIEHGGNWNIFQFKSKQFPTDRSDPFLSFNLEDHPDGSYTVYVYKKPENVSIEPTTEVRIRPREWFGIESLLVQSGSADGRLVVWILRDGRAPTMIIDRRGLTTRYPDGIGVQDWSVDNYGAELAPLPAELYVDDASIRRPR